MTALSLRRPPASERGAEQAINDFQSETAEIIGAPDPFGPRIMIWVMSMMFFAAIVTGSVMTLDKVVTSVGRIVPQTPTILVQPLEISIIRSINVRTGQVVRRGEVLATLDPTFSSADLAQLEQQAASVRADLTRLDAEAKNIPFVLPDNPGQDMVLQEAMWRYRQAEHTARLANFDQRIATSQATLKRAQEDATHYRSRLKILSEVEQMRRTLEKNQTGSRLNSLLATDTRVEVERNLSAADSTIKTAGHELQALFAEREVFIQQWRSTVLTDLANRRVDLDRILEDMSKAKRRFDLVELRAVQDAVVLEVGRFSVGSVVEPAKQIFTLMPLDAALEVEAEISAIDQGFVKVGDPVQIKFDAYRYMEHGMAKGVVKTISEDSFTRRDDQTVAQTPFYRARIELTDVNLRKVPKDFRLIPGMPLTADIAVGQRTIISYLLEGALKSSAEGMREP